MESSNEIRSAVRNIRYYSGKIKELVSQQFDRDVEIGNAVGVNIEPGTIRFDCLGAMSSTAQWIESYCAHIEANLKSAESQDNKLRVKEKDES